MAALNAKLFEYLHEHTVTPNEAFPSHSPVEGKKIYQYPSS